MIDLVTVDIGGTHARFAPARVGEDAGVTLGEVTTFRTVDHPTFEDAWKAYAKHHASPLPRAAAFSIAAPVAGDVIRLVNNPWEIRRDALRESCGIDRHTIVNDFGAVGHAVARLGPEWFEHLCGPDRALPASGTLSVIGPGTGLGIAHVWRGEQGGYRVQATEGGHFSFAPLDAVDDKLLERLRARFGRVSAERVVSGPAIVDIYAAIADVHAPALDDKAIWRRGIDGEDALATAAVHHFCGQLGAVAGDVALTQGGEGVVVAGGLGLRLRQILSETPFAARFADKGRFSAIMAAIPVKLITHPQPGLYGAAAAFATEHRQ